MGSVVLDAVNSFFGHHASPNHPQHDVFREQQAPRTYQPSPQPQTPLRAEAHMSGPTQRASSSSAVATPSLFQDSPRKQHAPAADRHGEPTAARPQPPPGEIHVRDGTPTPSAFEGRSSRPRKIKVRDLEHIQSFASEDMGSFSEIRSRSRSRSRGAEDNGPQYEISEMKVEHIIEMVAGLLTKITTTNDRQHEHLHRQPPSVDATSHLNQQTTSVLAFHGKNVPSITILSYLSRINKYCPTSYEVFLSLLVYFDRMTERVNAGPIQSLRAANELSVKKHSASSDSIGSSDAMVGVTVTTPSSTQQITPPHSGGLERDKVAVRGIPGTPHSKPSQPDSPSISPTEIDAFNMSHFFVVDSFNIHRLVIAGVTCASKFFSDIFYTNSRYAKVCTAYEPSSYDCQLMYSLQVGGLPLPELNHLELQFLLLNDFRLSVPVEEIEAYGTMLVEFYAREVVAQKQATETMHARSLSESSTDSAATVVAG